MSKKVVIMGGGTGIYPVITALKQLNVEITTVVAVSDSGGSTGRIRDEFGFQPVGDLRQSLAALAESNGQKWIREILLYRFNKGTGLKGHNLGNLILTALQDLTSDTTKALEIAEKVFRLEGSVIPVTQDTVDLKIHYQNGTTAVGEHILDENNDNPPKIDKVTLDPAASLNPHAITALEAADVVIIGPGDYYASIMATLVPTGVKKVFQKITAKKIYIVNLMTRATQTKDMTVKDHVAGIEAAINQPLDAIIVNNESIPKKTLNIYKKQQEFPVENNINGDERLITAKLLDEDLFKPSPNDTAHRSLLRHSSTKLKKIFSTIV